MATRKYSTLQLEELWRRADQQDDRGNLRSAWSLFLAAAKAGDRNAQTQVGYYYDTGRGVRRDRAAALFWYRRAYRRGDPLAAHNIGTIWRDEGNVELAAVWFQRAVDLGSKDSNLDLAKLYLGPGRKRQKAILYLNRTLKLKDAWRPDLREAKKLLKKTVGR